jgi:hypothetical protein
MPPPMLSGSGGKPDIQDLNGREVTPRPSRPAEHLLHAANRRSPPAVEPPSPAYDANKTAKLSANAPLESAVIFLFV